MFVCLCGCDVLDASGTAAFGDCKRTQSVWVEMSSPSVLAAIRKKILLFNHQWYGWLLMLVKIACMNLAVTGCF